MNRLAPSLLAADFSRLGEDVRIIEEAGAQIIHVDIMDGHFVSNISYGPSVMKSLLGKTKMTFDVHLMIEDPLKYIDEFVTENTEIITVHQESTVHLHSAIQKIKANNIKAGVALNPGTPVSTLEDILEDVDLVLVMSVNPGFGGQKFIENSIKKIKQLDDIRKRENLSFEIEVDGGINLNNIEKVLGVGANTIVVGSSVFKAEDISKATKEFIGKL